MIINILIFIVSLVLIIIGANLLTDGSASIAKRLGVSPLVIGLTIVAFGTSAPELVISLTSSINGYGDISIGNIIGSNIFNILAILGITSIIKPILVAKSTIRIEIPFMIIIFFIMLIMSLDNIFSGILYQANYISRSEGIILLMLFVIFIIYNLRIARYSTTLDMAKEENTNSNKKRSIWLISIMIVLGISGLVYGGNILIDTASKIARSLGVSDAIIGITLVAAGTSIPELATSMVAAYKKESDIAVGNIVGSCIFNVLLVIGLSSVVNPIKVNNISIFDFGVMIISAILMLVFSMFFGDRVIKRAEGIILFIVFLIYYTLTIVGI